MPEEPRRRGPLHQPGAGGGRARPVRHGPAGRGELCPLPEGRGSGHRQRPLEEAEPSAPTDGPIGDKLRFWTLERTDLDLIETPSPDQQRRPGGPATRAL